MTGFGAMDSIIMCNREVLANVNRNIDKLRTLKKSQEINHEIKKKKTEKHYEKQKKLIEKEIKEQLSKQSNLIESA